ncbi:OLC1v1028118C1 [Oldenlandia corymbosa var. corymbosa]|uniref:OLC1v1028118C1 n=1 Tax=Oldenlandia corymbosa var. corymbosa TaxID=529605 RepID=A0AAV1CB07_OLDCO|nr:OLC1v1028118C1 [Oldenlandia corymbosa var. corymbosa]
MIIMNCRRSNFARTWRWSKAVFRVTLVLGLLWLFCVGVLQNEAAAKLNAPADEGGSSRKHMMKMVEKRHLMNAHRDVQVNFVSKRRVPNGPDPIHNRRAGNSHRPPGRA